MVQIKAKPMQSIVKENALHTLYTGRILDVTPPGFEPRLAAPKTDVLPLHHGAIPSIGRQKYDKKYYQ